MSSIVDNFPQANEDPLSSGGKWSDFSALGQVTLQVVSNVVESSYATGDFGFAVYTDQAFSANQFAKTTFVVFTPHAGLAGVFDISAGVVLRSSFPTVNRYLGTATATAVPEGNTNGSAIFLDVDTDRFLLALESTSVWSAGDELLFTAIGDSPAVLTVYQNGVQVLQTTDSSISSGGYAGLTVAASFLTSDIQLVPFIAGDVSNNITVNPGSLSLTGIAPSRYTGQPRVPTVGSVAISGKTPVLIIGALTPFIGTLAVSGIAPTRVQSLLRIATVGSLTFVGTSISTARTITVSAGVLSCTGVAPTNAQSLLLAPAVGALTVAGSLPSPNTIIIPTSGIVSLTGLGILPLRSIVTATGSLLSVGVAPAGLLSIFTAPSEGRFSFAGLVAINYGRLAPSTGVLTASGNQPVQNYYVQPLLASSSMVGTAPILTTVAIVPNRGILTVNTRTPVLDVSIRPLAGLLGIAGVTLTPFNTLTIPTGVATINGQPSLVAMVAALPARGSLSFVGSVPIQDAVRTPSTATAALTGSILLLPFIPATATLSIASSSPFAGKAVMTHAVAMAAVTYSPSLDRGIVVRTGNVNFLGTGAPVAPASFTVRPPAATLSISSDQIGFRVGVSLDIRIISGSNKFLLTAPIDKGSLSLVVTHNLNDVNAVLAGDTPQWPWLAEVRVVSKTANTMTLAFNEEGV